MKKYRYFIPGIGFILFCIDLNIPKSDFNEFYGEGLGLMFFFALLGLHLPALVGTGFLILTQIL